MKTINPVAILVALVISGVFLYSVLTPPSMFNFLPFAIHEALFLKVTENGVSSSIEESTFILVFDTIAALLLFWLVYVVTKRILSMIKIKKDSA